MSLTPDGDEPRLRLTETTAATCILLSGRLGLDAVERLDRMLESLSEKAAEPVLLRIASTEMQFGAGDALGQLLSPRRRLGSRPFAVWADEPLVRRAIPLARLHSTPPVPSHSWDAAVPLRL